jgi:hypothetical protein
MGRFAGEGFGGAASLSELGVIASARISQASAHSVVSGYGVASVEDKGTGLTDVNLDPGAPDFDDMTVLITGVAATGCQSSILTSASGASFRVRMTNSSGTLADTPFNVVVIDNTVAS